jgi:1-acyl-sn-glycerol-3-phosphate acyltransferase
LNAVPLYRKLIRFALQKAGQILIRLLTRLTISGRQNYPENGPLILAGNHVGLFEIALMAVMTPYPVEFVGTDDIPLDPKFAWIANLWGYLPIRRGVLDREAIAQAAGVLNRNGILVIFPEGGIWAPGAMQARLGIAVLSSLSSAPILPIGFSGTRGALRAALRLERPHISMAVGELIDPLPDMLPGLSRKQAMEKGARRVLDRIRSLVPATTPDELAGLDEHYRLKITGVAAGQVEDLSGWIPEAEQPALAQFLLHPVMLDIFKRNLRLPVGALMNLKKVHDPARLASALTIVLEYLKNNPGLLTYRFGMEQGLKMEQGLAALLRISQQVERQGMQLNIQPQLLRIDDLGEEILIRDEFSPPSNY